MRLLRTLFGDLGLVALAAVFGWALWYTVREELNEVVRREVTVVIEADGGLDVSPRTLKVRLDVQGPRRAVDAFRTASEPRLVRRVPIEELPPGTDEARRDFTKDDLSFSDPRGPSALTIVEMDPPVLSVRVFRVETQEKTVAPPEFQGLADLSLRHSLQSYTNKARVRGAVSVLSTFREIRTFVSKQQLMGFAESLRDNPKSTAHVVLEIDPSQRDLFTVVEPLELWARVELSRVAEMELLVPVRIYQEPAPRAGASRRLQFAEINKPHFVPGDPPKVRLLVTGVPSALAALTGARVRAFVLESELPEDQKNGDVPVHVADLPAGVALQQEYTVYVEVGP
jgi:hypothetical protein